MAMRSKRAVDLLRTASIIGLKVLTEPFLFWLRAEVSVESFRGHRFPVYLLVALANTTVVDCAWQDLPFTFLNLPLSLFLRNIRVRHLTSRPEGKIRVVLDTNAAKGVDATLVLRCNYYSAAARSGTLFLPYFAHPVFYREQLHAWARQNRGTDRAVRLFFAGTVSEAHSSRFRFPILPRDRIIARVQEWLARRSPADTGRVRLVMTNDPRKRLGKHSLWLPDYMRAMADADFFLCPPGWLMPHAHNLVEALAVGTIPVTNYHEYMKPPLTPGVNCVGFRSLAELDQALESVLSMRGEEIAALRAGAIRYYDTYVDPESFGRRFLQVARRCDELVVNDESGA